MCVYYIYTFVYFRLLLGDREESRPFEKIFSFVMKPIIYLSPTTMSTPALTLSQAMINATVLPSSKPVQLMDISEIFVMAGVDANCSLKCS